MPSTPPRPEYNEPGFGDLFDFRGIVQRLIAGARVTIALGVLGAVLAALTFFLTGNLRDVGTVTRVIFTFNGLDRGEYPNGAKFHPDDLRNADIIAEALRRQQLDADELQATIRGAVTVEGIIPIGVVRERDRLRASGQTLRPYIADEYIVSLTLPRRYALTHRQRELLLHEIVSVYREKFQQAQSGAPLGFGQAFNILSNSDYPDYEIVLNEESRMVGQYLDRMAEQARGFRSARTQLTFDELRKQHQILSQVHLREALALAQHYGLSRSPELALIKFDLQMRPAEERYRAALAEEKILEDVMQQMSRRSLSPRPHGTGAPVSHRNEAETRAVENPEELAARSQLFQRLLEASMKTRRLGAEVESLQAGRKVFEKFASLPTAERARVLRKFEDSLGELKSAWTKLIDDLRLTHEDYLQQQHSDAIRVSMQPVTASFYQALLKALIVGAALGFSLGLGLALLRAAPTRP